MNKELEKLKIGEYWINCVPHRYQWIPLIGLVCDINRARRKYVNLFLTFIKK